MHVTRKSEPHSSRKRARFARCFASCSCALDRRRHSIGAKIPCFVGLRLPRRIPTEEFVVRSAGAILEVGGRETSGRGPYVDPSTKPTRMRSTRSYEERNKRAPIIGAKLRITGIQDENGILFLEGPWAGTIFSANKGRINIVDRSFNKAIHSML